MEESKLKYLVYVLVFCVVLAGVGGYYIGSNIVNDKKDTVVNKDNEQKENEQEVSEKTEEISDAILSVLNKALNENAYTLNVLNTKSSLNDLTDEELRNIAFIKWLNSTDSDREVFTESELENAFSKTLLGNMTLKHGDIKDSIMSTDGLYIADDIHYHYDSDTKLYTIDPNYGGHGGGSYIGSLGIDYNSFEKDDKYIVEKYCVYYIVPDIGPGTAEYYGNYNDAKAGKNELFKNPYDIGTNEEAYRSYDPVEEITNNFDKYKDKMTKVTYTFEIVDGNVNLIDYKI